MKIFSVRLLFLLLAVLSCSASAAVNKITGDDKNCLTLDFVDLPVVDALRIYFDSTKQNFVLDKKISGNVELHLNCVSSAAVLSALVTVAGLTSKEKDNIYYIMAAGSVFPPDSTAVASPSFVDKLPASVVKAVEPVVPPVVKIQRLYNLLPADVVPLLSSDFLTVKAFDDQQLFLSGKQSDITAALVVIAQIDKPKKQYMINAKLIASSNEFLKNLGVTFGVGANGNGLNATGDSVFSTAAAAGAAVATGGTALIVYKTSNVLLSSRVTAAITDGVAKLVSEPRTIAYENKESSITQGLRIPYQTQLPQGGYSIAFIDAALALRVVPRRGDDKDKIILDVYFSKNSAGNTSAAGVEIETREIKTTVSLKSGDTVILGGIDETSDSSTDTGIPYLRDIPVLGYVFGATSETDRHNKIVIMITPVII